MHGNVIDLTGKRYGRLVVIEMAIKKPNSNKIKWKCKCDCGNFVIVFGCNLKKKTHSRSCGCLQREMTSKRCAKDISGERYGRLVAVKITSQRSGSGIIWECRCDCGGVIYARAGNLMSGHTRSCGCLKREQMLLIARDITGVRSGWLTAIKETNMICDTKRLWVRAKYWECLCDCGEMTLVAKACLLSGNTKSCGCYSQARTYLGRLSSRTPDDVLPNEIVANRALKRVASLLVERKVR